MVLGLLYKTVLLNYKIFDLIAIVLLNLADGDRPIKNNHQRLGSAGLALHYANIITQIDTLVSILCTYNYSRSCIVDTLIKSFAFIHILYGTWKKVGIFPP